MYMRQCPERKLEVELEKSIERENQRASDTEKLQEPNCNEPSYAACILHVQNDPLFHYRGLRVLYWRIEQIASFHAVFGLQIS